MSGRVRFGLALLAIGALAIAVLLWQPWTDREATSVPVLWVGTDASGAQVGGVSHATVSLADDGTPGFSVDFQSQAAEGAGTGWQAASAMAAMVATLTSNTNPAELSIRFGVDGQIDGPSAGGVLTVATLAQLNDTRIRSGYAMTGTIQPSGLIGPVGGVGAKLHGAAAAGYTHVAVPISNSTVSDPRTGEAVDVVELGASLGLEVLPVSSIAEAYVFLTGQVLPGSQGAVSSSDAVGAVGLDVARELCAQVGMSIRAVNVVSASTDFTRCSDAAYSAARTAAQQQLTEQLAQLGVSGARDALIVSTASTLAESTASWESVTDRATLATALNLPQVLTRLSNNQARLTVLAGLLPKISSTEELEAAAGIIADAQTSLHTLFPLALRVVEANPQPQLLDAAASSVLLNQYAGFLRTAGEANVRYLQSLLKNDDLNQVFVYDPLISLNDVADELLSSQPGDDATLAGALRGMSSALSLWTTTSQLLGNASLFEIAQSGLGQVADGGDSTAISLAISAGLTESQHSSASAAAAGWDPSAASWFADGAAHAGLILIDAGKPSEAAQLALPRLWQATVVTSMMTVATTPASR